MKSNQYIPALDGWRGLAILLLLIGHFFPIPGVNFGTAGVDLFFVLSGFLMARVLFLDGVQIPVFYRRRISRIFPAAFFFIFVIISIRAVLHINIKWSEVAAAVGFVINYFPGEPGAAVMPFGHIWSLCVEEHSYIVLSLIAYAARKNRIHATIGIFLASVCCVFAGLIYYWTYDGQHLEFDRWIHSEVLAFGIFVSAFFVVHLETNSKVKLHAAVIPALLTFGLAMHWWSVPAPIRTFVGVTAFALAVNLINGAPGSITSIFSCRPLRQLGLWSFSIYLWQQPFYLLVHRNGLPKSIGIALAIAVGILSYYLIEKPVRKYLNTRWQGTPAII